MKADGSLDVHYSIQFRQINVCTTFIYKYLFLEVSQVLMLEVASTSKVEMSMYVESYPTALQSEMRGLMSQVDDD